LKQEGIAGIAGIGVKCEAKFDMCYVKQQTEGKKKKESLKQRDVKTE